MRQIHAVLIAQRRAATDVPHSIAASVGSVAPLPSGEGLWGEGEVSSEAGRCWLEGSRARITVRPKVQYPHPGPLPEGEGDLHQTLSLHVYDLHPCPRITTGHLASNRVAIVDSICFRMNRSLP